MTPSPAPLVTADELADLLGSPTPPVVLDVRYPGPGSARDGHAEHRDGHVPGARYVDLDAVLAAPHEPGASGRHPLPDVPAFEAGMRAAGVEPGRGVVVYDDWGSIAASRAWWLLRYAGHADVRVLDGGWRAWLDAGHPTETGERPPAATAFTAAFGALPVVDAQGAGRVAESGVLLDARPAGRFRGQGETIDPVAGHVPGAVSLPAVDLVDDAGRLLPAGDLADRFEGAGAVDGAVVAVMCGSGIQACLLALALDASGSAVEPALYAGSWSDWITDPTRPVAHDQA